MCITTKVFIVDFLNSVAILQMFDEFILNNPTTHRKNCFEAKLCFYQQQKL